MFTSALGKLETIESLHKVPVAAVDALKRAPLDPGESSLQRTTAGPAAAPTDLLAIQLRSRYAVAPSEPVHAYEELARGTRTGHGTAARAFSASAGRRNAIRGDSAAIDASLPYAHKLGDFLGRIACDNGSLNNSEHSEDEREGKEDALHFWGCGLNLWS